MTAQTPVLLKEVCEYTWISIEQDCQQLQEVIVQHAVAHHEIEGVRDGMLHYQEDEMMQQAIRNTILGLYWKLHVLTLLHTLDMWT